MSKKLTVADALAQTKRQVGQRQKVAVLLEGFPADIAADLTAALADKTVSNDHMAAVFNLMCAEHGIDETISAAAVRNYRLPR
jgi:hypothetical protein